MSSKDRWPRASELHRNLIRSVLFDLLAALGGSFSDGVGVKDIASMWTHDLLDYGQHLVDADIADENSKRRLLAILDSARPLEGTSNPDTA